MGGHLCSFTGGREQSIDRAKAPSRRWDNGWSCCWRSDPHDLFRPAWQRRERIRSQNERVSSSTAGWRDDNDTGGRLIEIILWKNGPGFAWAGSKGVTCWVISQYGVHLITPTTRNQPNTAAKHTSFIFLAFGKVAINWKPETYLHDRMGLGICCKSEWNLSVFVFHTKNSCLGLGSRGFKTEKTKANVCDSSSRPAWQPALEEMRGPRLDFAELEIFPRLKKDTASEDTAEVMTGNSLQRKNSWLESASAIVHGKSPPVLPNETSRTINGEGGECRPFSWSRNSTNCCYFPLVTLGIAMDICKDKTESKCTLSETLTAISLQSVLCCFWCRREDFCTTSAADVKTSAPHVLWWNSQLHLKTPAASEARLYHSDTVVVCISSPLLPLTLAKQTHLRKNIRERWSLKCVSCQDLPQLFHSVSKAE